MMKLYDIRANWNMEEITTLFNQVFMFQSYESPEAVVRRFSVKKVCLEISQNSQENTCATVSF